MNLLYEFFPSDFFVTKAIGHYKNPHCTKNEVFH